MRILVDTNIVLEIILEQANSDEAQSLLAKTDEHDFFLSDFSLHSIGLLLFRRHQHHAFHDFLSDMLIHAGMMVIALSVEAMESVIDAAQRYDLDFDDAYQYAAAEKYNLTIVSFDSDFDRTTRARRIPGDIL
jgi:predicted nucleic acid-binding protein